MKRIHATARSLGMLAALLAGMAAAQPAPTPPATTKAAVATPYDGLSAAKQAELLSRQFASGELAALSDAQVLAVCRALQPEALLTWARNEMNKYPEYEYWMTRQERVKGKWQEKPARMMIRYRHSPRQLYAKWLPGGAYAGQEIIYDETRRKNEMYGHLGGVMGFASMWIALDGSLARAQSNHTVLDLGFQFVLSTLERDAHLLRASGLSEKFTHAEIVQEQGERMVALTWELPADAPKFYAKKVQLMLDLKNPWPRVETAWSANGEMVEKIVFEKMVRKTFDASAFDPANDEYDF